MSDSASELRRMRRNFRRIRDARQHDRELRRLAGTAIKLTQLLQASLERVDDLQRRHLALCATIDRLNARERATHAN